MFGTKAEIADLKTYVIALKHSVDELHCRLGSFTLKGCSKEKDDPIIYEYRAKIDCIYEMLQEMTKLPVEKPKKRKSSRKKADASG